MKREGTTEIQDATPQGSETVEQAVVNTVLNSRPLDHGLPGAGWTLKKLREWFAQHFGHPPGKTTLHKLLCGAGLSWKKCKKLLGKASPTKRADYLEQFATLYQQMVRGEVRVIYVDESHFHRDLDLGYTWSLCGRPAWRVSDCPSLSQRINWYGAYDFTGGQCLLWQDGPCNQQQTAAFLRRLAAWVPADGCRVVGIWDGAPWHRAQAVQTLAAELGLEICQLPSYSPDFNPIEGLWKWMRECVLQHQCHATLDALHTACLTFLEHINQSPLALIDRLWPRFELDPEVEKLRFSM